MLRDQIEFPPRHLALREDVHQLGALVGEILREQGDDALYDLVEGDRVTAIRRRVHGDPDRDLQLRVAGRPPAVARDLVRAFSTWFQAVNLAERVHRIRRRREYFRADDARVQPGGVEAALTALHQQGMPLPEVLDLLGRLRIEPVLVAHPTESARRTLLRRNQRMANVLLDRLDPGLEPQERRRLWQQMRTELTTGWQTEEHPRQRLMVADEREHAIFHLAEVLYPIVPAFYEEIAAALEKLYGSSVADLAPPTILRFGSWVGGDMEGAPEVHAKSIRETLLRHQQVIVNAYHADCQELSQQLSQSASRVGISPALARRIEEYRAMLPGAQAVAPARHDVMPYRSFFAQVSARLQLTYEGRAGRYEDVAQFRADLDLASDSLRANRGVHAGYAQVRRLAMRARTFGFHLATLDLRQHADVHHRVLAQGLDDPQWLRRSPAERQSLLLGILATDRGPTGRFDTVGRRTLGVFDAIVQGRHRGGHDAVGLYVVSGARAPDDVLAPLVLARWAGAYDKRSGEVALDVAPMFESHDALARCGAVMRELLADPQYRRHLDARGKRQCVLVGYTHGSRDSGLLASRLSTYDAQRSLAATVESADEQLSLVHARGGSLSRGGMRIDQVLRSAPPDTVRGALRLTEQGETVSQNYGLQPNAMRTLERAFGALALATATCDAGRVVVESAACRASIDVAARVSRERWRRTVIDDTGFHDFFRAVTPFDVIERMQIGSREVWEGDAERPGTVQAVRSTPWVFAWSQSRHMLPGWFGAGTGLEAAAAQHGLAVLTEAYAAWPFFTTLIDDLEVLLARADLRIAAHYEALASAPLQRFVPALRDEYERSVAQVLAIKQAGELLDTDRTLQRAILLRNPYVDPMHLMQVDLLRRWRGTGREDEDLFKALLASVSGIAAGLQTTG